MVSRRETGVDSVELAVSGDLVAAALPDFRTALYAEIEQGTHRVAVDLGEVRGICSAAIGTLLLFQKRAADQACSLAISRISPELNRIFTAIKLDTIVTIGGETAR
jgi:anti-anti-sigma factor